MCFENIYLNSYKLFFECSLFVQIDLFTLQSLYETLRKSIVVWVTPVAHADLDFVFLQAIHVFLRCILNSLVRMMNKSCQIICPTCFNGLIQSVESQFCINMTTEFPADATPAEYINYYGQEYEFF